MSTDVMTPGRTSDARRMGEDGRRADGRRAVPGRAAPGNRAVPAGRAAPGRKAAPAPDARRPQRPARRPRPDRPARPMLPSSPVRPPSPIRPAGPGRPGRTIRTVGPPRHGYDTVRPQGNRPIAGGGQPAAVGAEQIGAERVRHAGRTSFVMLVLGLLAGGLVCLLVVNTTLAANSIQINQLEQANAARTQQIQQLQQETAAAQSAAVIAKEARTLGMRSERTPAFVDLRHHSLRVAKEPMR